METIEPHACQGRDLRDSRTSRLNTVIDVAMPDRRKQLLEFGKV